MSYLTNPSAWADLKRNLASRYGADEGLRRFEALQDGSEPDLTAWRSIGGQAYAAPPQEAPWKPRVVPAAITKPGPSRGEIKASRNKRICDLYTVGVDPDLIAERFGIRETDVWIALRAGGVRV